MKRVKYLIATLLLAFGITLLTSCDVKLIDISKVQGAYDLSGVEFNDATFTYDGKQHSIEVSGQVPEGLDVEYTGNKQTNVGWHKVTAEFSSNGTVVGSKTAYINIVKSSLTGVSLEGGTYPYTGEIPDVKIKGTLPAGVTVKYESNLKAAPGTYYVNAVFTGPEGYDLPNMRCEVTILEAKFDANDAVFASDTFTYDGNKHSLGVVGVPGFVTVTYTNNEQTEIGTYTVTAHFESTLCEVPDDMTATLTIIAPSVLSQVEFKSTTVKYNGNVQKLEATNLPDGITVSYSNNNNKDVGSYEVTAIFVDTKNPSNVLPSMKASLTIQKGDYDMSGVSFESQSINYDKKDHTVAITGELPKGVSVKYKYIKHRSADAGWYNYEYEKGNVVSDSLVYEFVAEFETTDPNYNAPADMTCKFEIIFASIDGAIFVADNCVYDGQEHGITLNGEIPDGVTATGYDEKHTDVGTYVYFIHIKGNGYCEDDEIKVTLTISKASYDLSEISLDTSTLQYIGNEYSVNMVGTLEDGITVVYDWDDDALSTTGIITVKMSFTIPDEKNYNKIPDMFFEIDATKLQGAITFDPDGGTMSKTTYTLSEIISSGTPIPTKANYYFGGWVTIDEEGTAKPMASANMTSLIGNYSFKATWISEADNQLEYELVNGTYSVKGIGNFSGYELYVPSTYNGKAVTALSKDCFKYNSTLYGLYLPDSIKTIGENAIYYMSKLEALDMGSGVTTLGNTNVTYLSKLTSLKISNNLTSVGNTCFYNLSSLKAIEIPNSITSIGTATFASLPKIKSISVPSKITELPDGSFCYMDELREITIAGTITKLGKYTLSRCPKLNLSLKEGLLSIDFGALGNTALDYQIEIPSTVNYISGGIANPSYGYYDIPNISISSNNTTYKIVDNAIYTMDMSEIVKFLRYDAVDEYTVPASVERIAEYCFSMSRVKLSFANMQGIVYFGDCCFNSSLNTTTTDTVDRKLNSWTFSDSTTYIGKESFMNQKLSSLDLSNITADVEIGESAFYANKLETLVIGNKITYIPTFCFAENQLVSVDLGNVTELGIAAFQNNSDLETVIADKLEVMGEFSMYLCKVKEITLPNIKRLLINSFSGFPGNELKIHIGTNDIYVEMFTQFYYYSERENSGPGYSYGAAPAISYAISYVFIPITAGKHGKITGSFYTLIGGMDSNTGEISYRNNYQNGFMRGWPVNRYEYPEYGTSQKFDYYLISQNRDKVVFTANCGAKTYIFRPEEHNGLKMEAATDENLSGYYYISIK